MIRNSIYDPSEISDSSLPINPMVVTLNGIIDNVWLDLGEITSFKGAN